MKRLFLSLLFIAPFSIQAMQTEKTDDGSIIHQHSNWLSKHLEAEYFQSEVSPNLSPLELLQKIKSAEKNLKGSKRLKSVNNNSSSSPFNQE